MSVRFNMVLSDELNSEIDKVVIESETSKSEILRKALQLYLAGRANTRNGLKLGFFDPKSREVRSEIVGL